MSRVKVAALDRGKPERNYRKICFACIAPEWFERAQQ
jgi:hypothetical protein